MRKDLVLKFSWLNYKWQKGHNSIWLTDYKMTERKQVFIVFAFYLNEVFFCLCDVGWEPLSGPNLEQSWALIYKPLDQAVKKSEI